MSSAAKLLTEASCHTITQASLTNMQPPTDDQLIVLMVAEKPSISLALASALSPTSAAKRKGVSPSSPVYEYDAHLLGRPARFRVTSSH